MTSAALGMLALACVSVAIVVTVAVCLYLERKGPARMDFNDR